MTSGRAEAVRTENKVSAKGTSRGEQGDKGVEGSVNSGSQGIKRAANSDITTHKPVKRQHFVSG